MLIIPLILGHISFERVSHFWMVNWNGNLGLAKSSVYEIIGKGIAVDRIAVIDVYGRTGHFLNWRDKGLGLAVHYWLLDGLAEVSVARFQIWGGLDKIERFSVGLERLSASLLEGLARLLRAKSEIHQWGLK